MKRARFSVASAVVLLATLLVPSSVAAGAVTECRDIISGDPIYYTVGSEAVVDVSQTTAAPDCRDVRYGLKVRPADAYGPTGPNIAFVWQSGDRQSTPDGQGEIVLRAVVPGAPERICVQGLSFKKRDGQPRQVFDRAPDTCYVLELDAPSDPPAGGRGWN